MARLCSAFNSIIDNTYRPAHEIWVLVTYGLKLFLNTHTDPSREVKGQHFDLSVHLYPFFVYASSEGHNLISAKILCTGYMVLTE